MSAVYRFESPIAQFPENPLTRNWPEPTAIDALFRYCVKRFIDICHADPRSWLTSDDLRSLLAQTLREELPSHGLPACSVHLSYPVGALSKPEAAKLSRSSQLLDLVLVVPDTIHWDANSKSEAALVLASTIHLGYEHTAAILDDIAYLAALRAKLPGLLVYLVVMGFQDEQETIDALNQACTDAGVTLLGDNYTRLGESVHQEKLL
ncbi:MAG: hypothetical protein ACYC6L_14105 [Anaerolineae bacterium]